MRAPSPLPPPHLRRRTLLLHLAAGGAALCTPSASGGEAATEDVCFFVVADPQIHLDKWGTDGTETTLRTLNALPGKPFPGGGAVPEPRAVLVAGDLVDVVDDPRHWEVYCSFFDPNGAALLRFRAFECIGNHDLDPTARDATPSVVQRAFVQRNLARRGPETFHYDSEKYHYSWDWGPLHLVNLNLFPGNQARPVYDRPAPWNDPRRSLDFLRDDLAARVGASGRPVVLMWHYGLRGWGLDKWWTPADLDALKAVLADYNIVLILHGHEHAYAHYEWAGIPVFMCPSPQRDRDPRHPEIPSTPKGFLVVRLKGTHLHVAHHGPEGWLEHESRVISLAAP